MCGIVMASVILDSGPVTPLAQGDRRLTDAKGLLVYWWEEQLLMAGELEDGVLPKYRQDRT